MGSWTLCRVSMTTACRNVRKMCIRGFSHFMASARFLAVAALAHTVKEILASHPPTRHKFKHAGRSFKESFSWSDSDVPAPADATCIRLTVFIIFLILMLLIGAALSALLGYFCFHKKKIADKDEIITELEGKVAAVPEGPPAPGDPPERSQLVVELEGEVNVLNSEIAELKRTNNSL
eukprot:26825_1